MEQDIGRNLTKLRLNILGRNELFGLEEILAHKTQRQRTVECTSMQGECFYITSEHFIHCVNQFKFSQQVVEEQIIKHQLYFERMQQTHEFQQRFIKNQRRMLDILLARD